MKLATMLLMAVLAMSMLIFTATAVPMDDALAAAFSAYDADTADSAVMSISEAIAVANSESDVEVSTATYVCGRTFNSCNFPIYVRSAGDNGLVDTAIVELQPGQNYWSAYCSVPCANKECGVNMKVGLVNSDTAPILQVEWAMDEANTVWFDLSRQRNLEKHDPLKAYGRYIQIGPVAGNCAHWQGPGDTSEDWVASGANDFSCSPADTVQFYVC